MTEDSKSGKIQLVMSEILKETQASILKCIDIDYGKNINELDSEHAKACMGM